MLAARYRQDHPAVPFDGVDQGIIRRRIAGVESNHHIGSRALVVGDVSGEEGQLIITQLLGRLIAELDHVFFQIQSDDCYIPVL